ncbi:hypothetical protein [Bosea sp. MMO-172]|uniref:hypothetical protein n=1 Tax=Bosea sp. MMO-172 TaxID=3127885 RepID=UPI003018D18F
MHLAAIIAELEGAAQQEAAGIHVLETTRFEPELGLVAERCIASARERADALAQAARRLRVLLQGDLAPGDVGRASPTVSA